MIFIFYITAYNNGLQAESALNANAGETYTVTMNGKDLFTITLDNTKVTVDGDGNATEYAGNTGPGGNRHGGQMPPDGQASPDGQMPPQGGRGN